MLGDDVGGGEDNEGFEDEDGDKVITKQPRKGVAVPHKQEEEDDEYEGPDFKSVLWNNTKHVLDILCIWDCTRWWIRFSELLSLIVFDAFTELVVTICIIVNVLFLALDHYSLEYDGM